jgi:hypothetical protein
MTAPVTDPASDTARTELVKIAREHELPAYVRNADINQVMSPADRPLSVYADPGHKKYACDTAAATWLSAAYFHTNRDHYAPKQQQAITSRLEKFANYHGIRPDYDSIVTKSMEKKASVELHDKDYAFVCVHDDGFKERFYPLTTNAQVKQAADWLYSNRDRIPFAEKNVIGNKILSKSAMFPGSLDSDSLMFIEKMAGRGVPDPTELNQAIQQRATLAQNAEMRDQLTKMAKVIKDTPHVALQVSELVKLATVLDEADYALRLKDQYGSILKRPEDVVFAVTFTKAAQDVASLCELQTGNVYTKEQLSKLSRDDVLSVFGENFVDDVSTGLELDTEKLAAVAHTLPRPDAEVLERLLMEVGQHPALHTPKSAAVFGTDSEALELAKRYGK